MALRRQIIVLTLALIAAQVLHDADHVRQDRAVEIPVVLIGILGYIGVFGVLLVARFQDRLLPLAAAVVGCGTVLGFLAVHVVPDWGPLADGYPDAGVDLLSWGVVVIDMIVALWLGLTGLRGLRAVPQTRGA